MARPSRDPLRRSELAVLAAGALGAGILLVVNTGARLASMGAVGSLPASPGIFGLKLLLMMAALLAPFPVLVLLGRALRRETSRARYHWMGLVLSAAASAGVVAMLLGGLVRVDLDAALDTVIAHVVPALVLLTTCACLYGGLVWLAQHGRLEAFSPSGGPPASRSSPE